MNSIVFPAPPSTYTANDFDEGLLLRIPFNLKTIIPGEEDKRGALKGAIPCIRIPYPGSNVYMIYSHGNACDIGEMFNDITKYADRFKVNVIAYEYPGYGIFKGSPSADTIKQCIKAVYTFLTAFVGIPSNNIILFGRSIGTGPSTYLAYKLEKAKDHSLGALILQSPYTSIRDIAKDFVGPALGFFAPKMFDNLGNIQHVRCPIILIHGEKDTLITVEHSKTLYENLRSSKKKFVSVKTADHNVFDDETDILQPIHSFLSNNYNPVALTNKLRSIPDFLFYSEGEEEQQEEKTTSFLSSISS